MAASIVLQHRCRRLSSRVLFAALLGATVPTVAEAAALSCSGALVFAPGSHTVATCEGDLLLPGAQTLRAEEAIELNASGNISLFGNLVAPSIVLNAGGNLTFQGGLFSGSPANLPDVRAIYVEGGVTVTRGFNDLVSTEEAVVHPTYGAITITAAPIFDTPDYEPSLFIADLPEALVLDLMRFDADLPPVPEPAPALLFIAGLLLLRIIGAKQE